MKYKNVVKGSFISRPNRFIAQVEINGVTETVHVKNTGRCHELLVPGAEVYLSVSDNPKRKTKFDLIAVRKIRNNALPILVNMDSQIPNDAAEEWLRKGNLVPEDAVIRREFTYGDSRFDFCIDTDEKRNFLEVKGVTLEFDNKVYFPDAPTERGLKHVRELIKCAENGFGAYILFVIQMKGVASFSPHDETHPQFGAALREAKEKGVKIIAVDCNVSPDSMEIDSMVEVVL